MDFLEVKGGVYMVDAGPLADNLLGSTQCRFGCVVLSLSPRNQKTVCDLHVSFFAAQEPLQCDHRSK